MTGKKAGVLNFEREVLAQVGEGKYFSGEGRRVLWTKDGEAYVVVFEMGAVVFGLDSKARAVIRTSPPTKLHQVRLLPRPAESGREVLAFSTEDGRVLFYDARTPAADAEADDNTTKTTLPFCPCIAQLGGQAAGMSGRIKDFEIVSVPRSSDASNSGCSLLVVTGSSDGAVRIWNQTFLDRTVPDDVNGSTSVDEFKDPASKQVGTLIGTLETGNRITCLGAFVMEGKPIGNEQLDGVEERDAGVVDHDGEREDESWDGFDGE
jgi:protein MAK11